MMARLSPNPQLLQFPQTLHQLPHQKLKSMGHLWTLLARLHSLAGPSIALIYPLYASIQALESPSKLDDEQWLAYWILYSFLTLVEMAAEPILNWVPIWYQIRLVLMAWLVLPQFRGAAFVYGKFVREQLNKFEEARSGCSTSPSSQKDKKTGGLSKKKDNKIRKFVSFVTPKKVEHEAY